MKNLKFYSLDEMLNSKEYQAYESDTLLNIQHQIINNPYANIDEILEHNSEGMFGHSHAEFINCWRDFIKDNNVSKVSRGILEEEISNCEWYHIEQNTIDELI